MASRLAARIIRRSDSHRSPARTATGRGRLSEERVDRALDVASSANRSPTMRSANSAAKAPTSPRSSRTIAVRSMASCSSPRAMIRCASVCAVSRMSSMIRCASARAPSRICAASVRASLIVSLIVRRVRLELTWASSASLTCCSISACRSAHRTLDVRDDVLPEEPEDQQERDELCEERAVGQQEVAPACIGCESVIHARAIWTDTTWRARRRTDRKARLMKYMPPPDPR